MGKPNRRRQFTKSKYQPTGRANGWGFPFLENIDSTYECFRYDLLCLEGLSRALRIFLGKEKTPKYIRLPYDEQRGERLYVTKEVSIVNELARVDLDFEGFHNRSNTSGNTFWQPF
jgi:hypothetical protein